MNTYNLAELLYWLGREDEAQPLADRSRDLMERAIGPQPLDHLLLARLAATRGDTAAAREHLVWLRTHCPDSSTPLTDVQVAMVEHALAGAPTEAWQTLVDRARACAPLDELIEIFHVAALTAARAGRPAEADDWAEQGRQAASASPIWRARFDAVRTQPGAGSATD
jgi:hypothetical protein